MIFLYIFKVHIQTLSGYFREYCVHLRKNQKNCSETIAKNKKIEYNKNTEAVYNRIISLEV